MIAKLIRCNDAEHQFFVDGDAMRPVGEALLAAAAARDAERAAAAADAAKQKTLFSNGGS